MYVCRWKDDLSVKNRPLSTRYQVLATSPHPVVPNYLHFSLIMGIKCAEYIGTFNVGLFCLGCKYFGISRRFQMVSSKSLIDKIILYFSSFKNELQKYITCLSTPWQKAPTNPWKPHSNSKTHEETPQHRFSRPTNLPTPATPKSSKRARNESFRSDSCISPIDASFYSKW